jgi:fructose-specific phosphotransferase system IIA component
MVYSMNLRKVLSRSTVTDNLSGETKEEVIHSLVELISNSGKVKDKEKALKAVLEREAKMSTGMKHGIAIPHGKTDAVSELAACVGVTKKPVEFDALDHMPCRIFIMTLSPLNKSGPHIQFLAQVSRILNNPDIRNNILEAQSEDEIISILTK